MVKQTRRNFTVRKQQQYTYTIIKKILTLVTDSTFMVKQTRRNFTVRKQQYTYTIMKKNTHLGKGL